MRLSSQIKNTKLLHIGLIAVVLVITAGLFFVINYTLDQRMGLLKSKLLTMFHEFSGKELSYSSISPSILQYFEIRDLVIKSPDQNNSTLLRVKNLKIHYDLFHLLTAADPLSSIYEVNIEHSEFNLDMVKDKELADGIMDFIRERLSRKIDVAFTLTGSSMKFKISDRNYNLLLSQLFLTLDNHKDFYAYKVRGNIHMDNAERGDTALGVNTEMDVGGRVAKQFDWFDMLVNIYSTDSDNFALAAQKFQVSMKDNLLAVNKIQDRTPIDIECHYNTMEESLGVHFITENWQPAHLIQFKKDLAEYNHFLGASITSRGELTYNFARKNMRYSLDLHAGLKAGRVNPNISLRTKVNGNQDILYVEPFSLSSNTSKIEFRGNLLTADFYPKGTLSLTNVTTGYTGTINAAFAVDRSYRGFSLTGNKTSIGKTVFDEFTLSFEPHKRGTAFNVKASLRNTASPNSLTARGDLRFGKDHLITSEWKLAGIPLGELYSMGTPDVRNSESVYKGLQSYLVNAGLKFSSSTKGFLLTSESTEIHDLNDPGNTVSLEFMADNNHIRVTRYNGEWLGIPLQGDVSVDFTAAKNPQFSTLLHLNDVPYAFSGLIMPGSGIVVSGSYNFNASVLYNDQNDLRFWVKTEKLPLPLKDRVLFASLNCIGYVKTDGEWQIASPGSTLYNLPVSADNSTDALPPNYVEASFTLSPKEFNFSKLRYVDTFSELSGSGKFEIASFLPVSGSGWLYLENNGTGESYTAELELKPEYMDLNLAFYNSPLSRLGTIMLQGNLSGNVRVTGAPRNPDITARLSLKQGFLNKSPFSMETDFSVTKNFFELHSLECVYNNNLSLSKAGGQIDKRTGNFWFNGHVAGFFLGENINADTFITGDMAQGDFSSLFHSFWDHNFNGRMQFFNITAKADKKPQENYASWELLFTKEQNLFSFSGGPRHAVMGQIKRDGSFDVDLTDPLPLRSHIEGRIKNNFIEAKLEHIFLDLQLLNPLIASKYFVFKRGTAQGDLTLAGDIADPRYYGLVEVKDAAIATAVSPNIISPINTAISFQDNEMRLTNTKTYLGNAPVNIFAVLTLKNWVPTRYALDLKTLDTIGMHIAFPADVINVDGYFLTPNFKLVGSSNSLRAEGDLVLPRCNVTLGNPQSAETTDSNFVYLVNLNIKTGKAVEFTWPTRDFPIIQAVAKPDAKLAVQYNGNSGKYSLTGDVDLQSGEVYYFDRSFFIRSGLISFRENERRFDPIVSLEAEKREQLDGQDYKIFLTMKNQYLSEFEPHFRSEPPLASEYDILAAMGGVLPDQGTQPDENALDLAVNLGSDILTQVWVLRPFERVVKNILNLDVFSIRTQIVKNILFDKVLTGNNSQNQDPLQEGRSYLENTTINLGQYIGDKNDLYLEMVLRFQSMDETAPEYESITTDRNVNVESEFSLELTTPFFLTIKWTVTPQHWESFFLPDNKITLKWGFSF
ncbi:MAG: translocation/assembly module TamB domain-containing protein [Spirochaetia bacterium]